MAMNKEELIGKLQMTYVGDRNAFNELVGYYDGLKQGIEKLQQENKHLQQQLDQALKDYEEQLKINEEHQKLNGELQVRLSKAIETIQDYIDTIGEVDIYEVLEKLKGE